MRQYSLAGLHAACRLAVGRGRYELAPHWVRHHPTAVVVVGCSPSRLAELAPMLQDHGPPGVSVVVHRRRRTPREWWADVVAAIF